MATLFNTKIKDTYQSLLKLEDNTILTTTTKNVTDGLGNASPLYMSTTQVRIGSTSGSAMYWDNVNNRLGIGTTTPLGILHLKSTAATTRMVMDGDAGQSKIITYRTAGLQRFGLYVNNTAESGSNAGSDFAIRAYNDAGTLLNTPVFIKRSTGNVGINTITGTAKLQVVGSGSTSATTSLLVQNSGGNAALTILDDRTSAFGSNVSISPTAGGTIQLGVDPNNMLRITDGSGYQKFNISPGSSGGAFSINGGSQGGTSYNSSNSGHIFSFPSSNNNADTVTITRPFRGNINLSTINLLNITSTNEIALSNATLLRGLYINPTVTDWVSVRAIETTAGNVIFNGGNVGIGTTEPANKLSIKQVDSNTSMLRLDSASSVGSNTYQAGIDFYTRITLAGGTDSYPVGKIYGIGGGEFRQGSLRFQTIITNGGSLTDTMTLYQGNVAIGSLSPPPSKLLQVTGLKDTVVADFSSNTVANNEGVSIQLSAQSGNYPLGVIRGIYSASGGFSAMTFSTTNSATITEAIRITSSQNVLIGTTTDSGYKLDVNGTLRSGIINFTANNGKIQYSTDIYMQFPAQGGPVAGVFADGGYGWNYSNGSQIYSYLRPGNGTTTPSTWTLSESTKSFGRNTFHITTDLTNASGGSSVGETITLLNVNGNSPTAPYAYRPSLKVRAGNSGTHSGADQYAGSGHLYLESGDANSGTATDVAGGTIFLNSGRGTGTGTPGNIIFSTSTATTTGTTLQTLSERMRINGSGNVGVGEASPTARLQVKGSGSTSATTSLLVQNSSATTILSVNDAGNATIGGTLTTGGDITTGNIGVGKGKSTGIYNTTMGNGPLASATASSTVGYTVAIGRTAGFLIASGIRNVIIGAETAQQTGAMSNSIIIGAQVFGGVTSTISETLAIGTGDGTGYTSTIYATNITSSSPNVRIGNNYALTAAVPTALKASAILELSSTTKGFLPPQMTTAEKNLIATPATGLMVFDTTLARPCFFNGATWITL